jgi:hypothetical protein
VEAIGGLASMPETIGAGGLVAMKGAADMGLGGMAMVDGVNLIDYGFNGVQHPSTAASVGASMAGDSGAAAGEFVNGVGTVRDVANGVNRRRPSGIALIFAMETLSRYLPEVPDSMQSCNDQD